MPERAIANLNPGQAVAAAGVLVKVEGIKQGKVRLSVEAPTGTTICRVSRDGCSYCPLASEPDGDKMN